MFFGTEDNSPIILRYYACALMEKAHQIDPTLLSNGFAEWKKQLLGIGADNNSTCTAILSDDMIIYAREHCNDTFKKISSPSW
nr:hypothetical protein [Arsenophonus endosymbiont of Aleurodicus floccissimus]